jgi:dihydrofolate synthase/folylpolyglutamate synthase
VCAVDAQAVGSISFLSQPATLEAWLQYLESRNREAIVLGLDRVARMRDRLGLQPSFPIFTVGGTNGKGSVCAYLEAVLTAANYRVGCYSSPHLLRYNERVHLDGREATDVELCEALAAVESARDDVPLTYFEQGTLAAMWLFQCAGLDVVVLEVGLGGRLDAVNIWDADCAVVTSIDLDHQQFLGETREAIGFEKAGIFRANRPAVCGDADPPASLLTHANSIGAQMLRIGEDIRIEVGEEGNAGWICRVGASVFPALPRLAMPGRHQYSNAACAVAALWSLRERLPVSINALRAGLASARQPGRFQVIGQQPLRILDVAHNPHAARALAANLADLPPGGKVIAVCAMLADKDVAAVVATLQPYVQYWHGAGLAVARGLDAAGIARFLLAADCDFTSHSNVQEAWRAACLQAGPADTIIAFGSFHTVAEVMAAAGS